VYFRTPGEGKKCAASMKRLWICSRDGFGSASRKYALLAVVGRWRDAAFTGLDSM
jgi:hypothetical protein